MANPLPNEKELYERIEQEGITISWAIWDLFYNHIGDNLTGINLLCRYYLNNSEAVPIDEAGKILHYTRHIKELNNNIAAVSKETLFPELKSSLPLHPVIREMLTHYIGNDIYMINLIVQDSIDPLEPHPLSRDNIHRILLHTHSISDFMDRLRVATAKEEEF
jgi:hypothetical protein